MRGRPGRLRRRAVLLACHQWDPRGLARRLPSRGAGAWRGEPLLPWRVQCPGPVCAALAAASGGWGRCRVSCVPCFPRPAPRSPRCVWRVLPSGYPLSSIIGTQFHAVSAFLRLGLVALLVFPACPLCVCVCSRSRGVRPPPLPWLVWRAHPAWSRCWAPVGPFHVSCTGPVLCLACFWGGWGGPVSPLPGLGPCAPRGVRLRVRGVPAPGVGLGWVGSRPHPDLRDHGRRPSLRVTTGPVDARLSGLMTAPVPRGGTRGRELPPCLCLWGARAACACGAGAGGAARHAGGWDGVGGAACAPVPPTVWLAGPVGWGVALPRSVPLPFLGRQQSGCLWRCSGHGGRGPHTAQVRARLLSPGAVHSRPCVPAQVCLSNTVPAGAGGQGRGGGPCCVPPPGRRGPAGGWGVFSALGGVESQRPRGPRVGGGSAVGPAGRGSRRGSLPPSSG